MIFSIYIYIYIFLLLCLAKNVQRKKSLFSPASCFFGNSYWNFPYEPEKYNFAQFAINKGYSIFFYDRLGTGISSK